MQEFFSELWGSNDGFFRRIVFKAFTGIGSGFEMLLGGTQSLQQKIIDNFHLTNNQLNLTCKESNPVIH